MCSLRSWSWVLQESTLIKLSWASQKVPPLYGLYINSCLQVLPSFEFLPWLLSVKDYWYRSVTLLPFTHQQASGCVVFPTPLKPLLRKIPCRLVEAKIISQCYGNHNHWRRMRSHLLFSKSLLWVSLQESQAEEQRFNDIKWKLRSVKFIYLVPGSNFWDSYTKRFDF